MGLQILSLRDGPVITLEQMLAARDLRVERQQAWIKCHQLPIISLTMVIPGEVKKSSASDFLFNVAIEVMRQYLVANQIAVIDQQHFFSECGSEALFAVNTSADQLKDYCIHIEQSHPLGRFWDFDVVCPVQGGLSRKGQNTAVRKCLLCDNTAHACARSRQHPLPELIAVIEENIHAFRSTH